jgi:hypothetical protein
MVGGLVLALTNEDVSGLADWCALVVPNRDSYCANLPICGGAIRQVQPIGYLYRMSSWDVLKSYPR